MIIPNVGYSLIKYILTHIIYKLTNQHSLVSIRHIMQCLVHP